MWSHTWANTLFLTWILSMSTVWFILEKRVKNDLTALNDLLLFWYMLPMSILSICFFISKKKKTCCCELCLSQIIASGRGIRIIFTALFVKMKGTRGVSAFLQWIAKPGLESKSPALNSIFSILHLKKKNLLLSRFSSQKWNAQIIKRIFQINCCATVSSHCFTQAENTINIPRWSSKNL